MKPELKKLLILNAPYLLFVYLFDKIGQAVRLSPGTDLSGKVLSLADGFSAAFTNPLPSLAPMDLLIGIVGAVLIRLMVYFKGKNAKKLGRDKKPSIRKLLSTLKDKAAALNAQKDKVKKKDREVSL